MDSKTKYTILLAMSAMGFISAIYWISYAEDITLPLIFIGINIVGVIAGFANLEDVDKNTPITEEVLRKLKSFGKEPDTDNFSDWFEFSIIPIPKSKRHGSTVRWSFQLFNEVDGKTTFVRYVDNMQQLKDVYKGITDKELD